MANLLEISPSSTGRFSKLDLTLPKSRTIKPHSKRVSYELYVRYHTFTGRIQIGGVIVDALIDRFIAFRFVDCVILQDLIRTPIERRFSRVDYLKMLSKGGGDLPLRF